LRSRLTEARQHPFGSFQLRQLLRQFRPLGINPR
jgi:hypothetical protein